MENEEDESGPNPLPDSPTPQLQLQLDSAVPISGPESQCDSETVLARDSPPERLAGVALPPEREEVVDVISGEREGQVGFEIGAGVADGEEEEAVEKDRVIDGVEEETQGDDDGGVEGDTVVGSDGGFSELDGAGLVMAHNDAEDMDNGRHVDAASSVVDTDIVFVTGEEGVEVGDDDNTEGIEVVENLNDTEPVDVGEDAHFVDTGNEVAREIDEVEETEVADVGEDTHFAKTGNKMAHEPNEVGEDTHFNDIVNEMADDPDEVEETEVAEVGEDTHFANTGNEMVHEPVEVEETEVADVGEDAHFANTGNEMAHEQDVVGETKVVDVGEDSHFANTSNEMDHAAEEAGETEVVDVAEDVEEMEVVDAAEEAKVTEVVDAAEDVEKTEVADAAEEVEETEAAEGDEEIELADAGEEAEEIDVADDGEESEETEVADDAKEANETMLDDVAEETEVADVAEEADVAEDTVMEEAVKNGGKRKRGRIPKAATKVSKKKVEEDVCFICFDGGELVLCDRRGCPKAYHPACVNRDEAFFRAKGKWNCGWHLCSNCEKNTHYMCYTCNFSLCKACIKDAVILCVKGNKGFCEACMKTVLMIEQKEQENQEVVPVNFDDKSSFEYLFKDYWTDLKERLQLTADDITNAKNPWKGSHVHASKQASPDELYDATNDEGGSGSDSPGNAEAILPKKRKPKKRLKSQAKVADSPSTPTVSRAGKAKDNSFEWASNELLEFVMHMRNGDKSVLSQFDVQALLLEYIKRNKLRDPRRKSQIICDQRLVNLFGKQRVGHFEMLKLIESHFHVREDSQADEFQGSIVDTEAQLDADGSADAVVKAGKAKKRKRKNSRAPQSNLDDYAAIDMHNISLIYLKRSLLEDLIDDTDNFHDKVVGTFVRIRIAGAQKHDMYRLVQVVGTSKVAEPYKVGKRMTHTMLEVLNLNKTEVLSIDIISNHEFTEDECKRLRQSIKCGLINRLTVGDIQEKAMALQAVRVKDWFETEIVRLNHLCDRASDLGKKKQLRECVEKLQLLKSPEERQRRLEEIPEIHADPNMDPNYESEEAEGETDDKKQDNYLTPRGTTFGRKGREPISPRMGGSAPNDSWSGTRNYSSMNRESSRSMSIKGGLFTKGDDAGSSSEIVNKNVWNQGRDMETSLNSHEKPKTPSLSDAVFRNINSAASPSSFSVSPAASLSTSVSQPTVKVNETEKMWHYRDPSGKVQGPFSIVQLRKWNKSGYFPTELRIWKASANQDDSILLTDALAGKIQKEPPVADNTPQKVQTMSSPHLSSYSGKPYGGENPHFDQNRVTLNPHGTLASSGRSTGGRWSPETENMSLKGVAAPSVEIPKLSASAGGLRSDYNRTGSTNLPSPTPTTPGGTVERAYENKWSPTSVPASSQQKSFSGNKGQNVMEYLGASNVVAPSESQRVQVNSNLLQALNPPEVSLSTGADSKDVSASLQNLIQSLSSHVPPGGARGWVSGVVANAETTPPGPVAPVAGSASQAWAGAPSPNSVQQPLYGHYGNAPSSSFGAGNHTTGGFPSSGFSGLPQSSDPWRPPISAQQPNNNMPSAVAHQQNNMPSVPAHQQNNMPPVAAHQQNNMPPVAPNTPWAGPIPANPNMGWMGPAPGNPSWLPTSGQGQPAGNANPGWAPPGQGPAPGNANPGWAPPGQGPAPGNSNPGWAPPGQGPRPVNGNNPGWVAPGQGPLPGNSNSGWNAPTGNSGNNRDPGYGGGKPWNNNNNRQSSFNNGGGGGGGSRPRVCRFHENGHCKKGSSCNYMHT